MLNRFIPILAAFLLTGFTAAAQETNEKIVALHLSDNTDLVHFKEGDYILSFHRADLLEPFANYDWLAACTELLTVGDTLDYDDISQRFFELCYKHELKARSFTHAFRQCLADGRLKIHSTVSGRDLARIHYAENRVNPSNQLRYAWVIEDLSNDTPICGLRKFRTIGTPAF